MSLIELGSQVIRRFKGEPIRRDVVPLPFRYQPPDRFVDGVITMAQLVDNFYRARGEKPAINKHTAALQKVTSVMAKEKLSEEQKRAAVADLFGLKLKGY